MLRHFSLVEYIQKCSQSTNERIAYSTLGHGRMSYDFDSLHTAVRYEVREEEKTGHTFDSTYPLDKISRVRQTVVSCALCVNKASSTNFFGTKLFSGDFLISPFSYT